MRCPAYLDTEAKNFWKRHCQHCLDNGSLTEETSDSFAIACRVWSLLQSCDPTTDSKEAMRFTGLLKWLHAYSKPFGLVGSKPPVKKTKDIGTVLKEALDAKEDA